MAYTKYSLTPANNNAAPPDGAPEGMLPSGVNDTMRDMMAQIRDVGDGIRGGTYTMTAPVITGGSVSGITDLAIADGGTGASTAADARVNLGVDNYGMLKNRIINGAMVIDQRNAGASVTANGYFVDRFSAQNTTDGAFSAQQDSDAPAGFVNSIKFTTTTADASLTGTQNLTLFQPIEGYNIADFGWGTASAKTVTLSFWVRSSLTGTFGGGLRNSVAARSYPFSYTISSANTWEYKTVTIARDTSGTWLKTNGVGLFVNFGLGAGPDRSGTAGAWVGANNISTTGAVSVIGTLNATWQITGVQLEVGTQATSFEYRQFTTELQLCQRYLPAFNYNGGGDRFRGAGGSTTESYPTFNFPVTPRTPPTGISVSSASHWSVFNNRLNATGAATAVAFGVAGASVGELTVTTTAGTPTLAAGDAIALFPSNASAQILFTGCEL